MNETMRIKKLLNKVGDIVKQNEEISILKGENFNVFQIFNMENDENKMHSRFINTLINPNGSHGRGTIFLELFLKTLDLSDYFENINDVRTKVEHSIGEVKINKMESSGGRIDIFLWDKKKSISIENKVYANDQEKQIVRYWNYQKDKNKVFYLNLYGTEPRGDYSKGMLKSNNNKNCESPDFYCISYSETILDWLVKCQKEASDFPIIRETIKQYVISIKRLTKQLTSQKMDTDIKNIIVENYRNAKIIANNIENTEKTVTNQFLEELKKILKDKLGKSWIVEKEDIKDKWSKLIVKNENWISNARIALEGQPYFWKNETILGFPCGRSSKVRKLLKTSLGETNFGKITTKYPKEANAWFFYRSIFKLSNENQFAKLLTRDTKDEFINEISSEIIDLTKKLDKHLKK